MSHSASPSKARLNGILCGLASACIWGAFPVVTRLGLTHTPLDGYDITFIRYAVSGVVLLPYLMRAGLRGLSWKAIALMVAGIGAPYMLVVSFGLSHAPVEQFAVVTPASMIVFSTLISVWALGMRFAAQALAGIAIIILGVALAGYQGLTSPHASSLAFFIFLAGGLLWAVYTVSSKVYSTSALHGTAVVSVFSMLLYSPFYLALNGARLLDIPVMDLVVQAVYQGLLVSVAALFFYSSAVQMLGAAIGATFAALVPGSAIVLAALMLGEPPNMVAIAGLLIVTTGTAMALWQRHPAHRASTPATDPKGVIR
ncbi:DMT family transporter [Xanthobacter variabilis]|uniref:DMT family transporter n=1 Tax=Xanthobacter variabilis TaxID=3119932 RepID=UPI00372962BB